MKNISFLFLFISLFSFTQKQNLKKEINAITKGKNATVAVSVTGIDFPFQFENKNAEKKLPMLSVFKFHIALAVLNEVDEGKLNLEQKIFIKKAELLENTWSPIREKYPEGNIEMPLSELIKYTVAQSDNNGCDILLRLIGGTENVQNFINNKGIKDFQIRNNEEDMTWKNMYDNFSTTNAINLLLKKFFAGKIVSKKSTDFLMKIMQETSTGTNKLKEQLPKNSIAHKTGSSGKTDAGLTIAENDAGIVTLPNGKHYAITVFVSDSMEKESVNTKMVSDISKIVFDYFSKK